MARLLQTMLLASALALVAAAGGVPSEHVAQQEPAEEATLLQVKHQERSEDTRLGPLSCNDRAACHEAARMNRTDSMISVQLGPDTQTIDSDVAQAS
mmetsp:Transcript_36187/g.93362  ORF Transcript_36187/g.93362 Transcript_36187/m.93362 type:complete len:97 (-) Transcript_36187:52-342(-)